MAQLAERPLCDRGGGGGGGGGGGAAVSIPGRLSKWYQLLFRLALSIKKVARNQNWSTQCQYNVTGWNIMSCVWCVIFI